MLEFVVFTCGAVVMIFELVGSRVLAPYFGTSIFVWTSLIGVILGSLSLGYHYGGKLADKKPTISNLSLIILLSSICIGITVLVKDFVLVFLQANFPDIRVGTVVSALFLFMPSSILLGMVSPYAAKLKLSDLNNSGATLGNLYALSTAGSIFGTFLAGFYLIPYFGTNNLLVILALALVTISGFISSKKFSTLKLFGIVLLINSLFVFGSSFNRNIEKDFIDIDTKYNRIWIYNRIDSKTNRPVKIMGINNENHSSMFLDSNELVNEYTKYYHLAKHFNPDFKTTLLFGGAGYSFPKSFLDTYPSSTIDVVEIDPQVTELAKKYFNLKGDLRLSIYHEDGRIFLNKTKNKYDVIFGDAFGASYSLPYQLTTLEAVQKKYEILNDNGVVLLNMVSAIDGKKGEFLKAEYATYKKVFPQVYLFPVKAPSSATTVQNLILVALKSTKVPQFNSSNPVLNSYLGHLWKKDVIQDVSILTDDFAPVDHYLIKSL